jgi:hypothetical protein
MIYKINLIDLVQVLTLLSTIFHLYRGRQFYWEESHRNYPLDYMKEKRTLQGNITQAPSEKMGARNGLSGFTKQQHHKVQ